MVLAVVVVLGVIGLVVFLTSGKKGGDTNTNRHDGRNCSPR